MVHTRSRRAVKHFSKLVDHAIGRALGRRRVLFDLRNAMNIAVLQPLFSALQQDTRVHVAFACEVPARVEGAVRKFAGAGVLDHDDAAWQRWDLYVSADPWTWPHLHRCARSANFFHGVAGKSNLDDPSALQIGFDRFDRVGFINAERMGTYVERRIVARSAAVLVGFPKMDRLGAGAYDRVSIKRSLGLAPGRPTALYAPTWSPASSLHLAGERIVASLRDNGFNVIVKLHPLSFDPSTKYSGGVDWRSRMHAIEEPGRVVHVDDPDVSPLLAASDTLVTDHSTVGFEYCVLQRPIIVFDTPELARVCRINLEQVTRLRGAACIVRSADDVGRAARDELACPDRLTSVRAQLAARMFYGAGSATARAMAVLYELLELPRLSPSSTRVTQNVPGAAPGLLPHA
jgi:hypothetical protein